MNVIYRDYGLLARLNTMIAALGEERKATEEFCTECQQAWESNDLDEMIRRRDQLHAQLQREASIEDILSHWTQARAA